jgi:ABC-2 type transport system permease protein
VLQHLLTRRSEPVEMKILSAPFFAVFQNEVRLNSKRIAPYFMFLLCAGNGLLWWGWGPATGRGWAVNSDFFISGALPVYSFFTLPLFTALFMADPVNKDFRYGVDPLIFSAPISRAQYLLGKFFGNFFVLMFCQSAFVLAWFLLQLFHKEGVVTVPGIRVVPYIKHFLVLVVISHLALAAFYFTVGALTRSAKIVYGLGVSFYPIYGMYQIVFLKSLPTRWGNNLDPFVAHWNNVHSERRDAAFVNHLPVVYDFDLIANRVAVLLVAALLLTLLYYWFKTSERSQQAENYSWLNLSTKTTSQFYEIPSVLAEELRPKNLTVPIPAVSTANGGLANNSRKLLAALAVEFRLLLAERSFLVVMSLAVFLSIMEVTFWPVRADPSFSAAYAANTARSMLLFLVGIPIFYVGEAIHRDRDVRVEGLLWSHPIPNYAILSAKFLSTLLLVFGLILSVGFIAIVVQILKGNTPLELSAYLNVYMFILIPNAIFLCAISLALHVLLRSRYLAYTAGIGLCIGLLYYYSQGHTGSLYNPLLYNLWSYSDLAGPNLMRILMHRCYILALAVGFITVAHLANARRTLRMRW